MKYALIFGGVSFEHEISIVSAVSVANTLKDHLDLVYIFCDEEHNFYFIDTPELVSTSFSSEHYTSYRRLDLKEDGFYTQAVGFFSKHIKFDIAINLIHGNDGEDGVISSLLDFYDIPYIGPSVEACSISFSKYLTKMYANNIGVKTLAYQYLNSRDKDQSIKIDFPCIIKPNRLGSSIGISIVKEENEIEYALDSSYEYDSSVVIEPFIEDVAEYTLAGVKDKNGEYIFSMLERTKKDELYTFDQKYLNFTRSDKVSASGLSEDIETQMKENFKKIYSNMFDGSLIRCDFFVIDDEVHLVEINSIPGSLSNYLFEDFVGVIKTLSEALPQKQNIKIDYKYLNHIKKVK